MGRTWRAALGALVLLGLVAVGPPTAAQTTLTEVTLGTLAPSASEWPVYLAEDGGFFAQEGIRVTVVTGQGPTPVIQALASGGTDLADDGTDSYIAAVAHGLPIKMIAPQFKPMPYQLVVGPKFDSWSQLKGQSIMLGTKKDVTAIAFYKMAEVSGHLKDSDFSLVVGGTSSARYAALLSGNAQGAMLGQPFDLLAQQKGMKVLASGQDYFKNDWMFTAVAVNTQWGQSHRDLVVKMLRALRNGIAWGYSHREPAVAALMKVTNIDHDIAEQAYDVDFTKWKAFDPQQKIDAPAVQNIANIMVQQGDISAVPPMDALFDLSFAADAARAK